MDRDPEHTLFPENLTERQLLERELPRAIASLADLVDTLQAPGLPTRRQRRAAASPRA